MATPQTPYEAVLHAARDVAKLDCALDAEMLGTALLGSVYAVAGEDRSGAVRAFVTEFLAATARRRAAAATTLSGGEQQMLALARVLRMGARLLLCDEPTEGLSPLLVQQVGDILRQAKEHGVTVLLVEQNLHFATGVADRHYLLSQGRVVESMDNSEVRSREHELLSYLGI